MNRRRINTLLNKLVSFEFTEEDNFQGFVGYPPEYRLAFVQLMEVGLEAGYSFNQVLKSTSYKLERCCPSSQAAKQWYACYEKYGDDGHLFSEKNTGRDNIWD
jgi:hypothetical protein